MSKTKGNFWPGPEGSSSDIPAHPGTGYVAPVNPVGDYRTPGVTREAEGEEYQDHTGQTKTSYSRISGKK